MSATAEPDFSPFVPRQRDATVLVLSAPPSWAQRLTRASAQLTAALAILGVPGIGWLMWSRPRGALGIVFGLVAIGALVGVARLMRLAVQLESITGLRVDADGLTVITGRGRDARATWLDPRGLQSLDVSEQQADGGPRLWLLTATQRDGPDVRLGWLRVQDQPGSEAAVAELRRRLGLDPS